MNERPSDKVRLKRKWRAVRRLLTPWVRFKTPNVYYQNVSIWMAGCGSGLSVNPEFFCWPSGRQNSKIMISATGKSHNPNENCQTR
eukprot:scaffold44390_cov153-Amphora_coffeaeformis.AAC.2